MTTYNRGLYVKKNGSWVPVNQIYYNNAGTWTPVIQSYVNRGGVWTTNYPSNGNLTVGPGTTTFTVPPGIYELNVDMYAGGGGGGAGGTGASASSISGIIENLVSGDKTGAGCGGGGSGGYLTGQTLIVTPGQVITLNVGQGGSPGASKSDDGTAGTDTVITAGTASLHVTGGQGGQGGESG